MSCIEGRGDLKDIHCIAQNVALFVSLFSYLKWFQASDLGVDVKVEIDLNEPMETGKKRLVR